MSSAQPSVSPKESIAQSAASSKDGKRKDAAYSEIAIPLHAMRDALLAGSNPLCRIHKW